MSLTFSLDQSERETFREAVGSSINDTLPIQLAFGQERMFFHVPKQRWAAQLARKIGPISEFVSQRIQFVYIPAVRTPSDVDSVIDSILAGRLAALEADSEYQKAIEKVRELQEPVLQQLSQELTTTLQEFLPAVKGVSVDITPARRYERLRTASEVTIDDSVPTPLESKGDGVVSLAAIGLMRHSLVPGHNKHVVLAIEEPESHLHPKAMHLLRQILHEVARPQQVVITTHSPLFAERRSPSANVLVRSNSARPARSISDIRDALGVRVQDNLYSAGAILMVEGPCDQTAVTRLLKSHSRILEDAIDNHILVVQPLGGCTRLASVIYAMEASVLDWHCLLDFDDEARRCVEELVADRIVLPRQVTYTRYGNQSDAELEDWYHLDVYREWLHHDFGPVLDHPTFQRGRGKWSVRMRAAFAAMGLDWDSNESRVKGKLADSVAAAPLAAVKADARAPFGALVKALEGLGVMRG